MLTRYLSVSINSAGLLGWQAGPSSEGIRQQRGWQMLSASGSVCSYLCLGSKTSPWWSPDVKHGGNWWSDSLLMSKRHFLSNDCVKSISSTCVWFPHSSFWQPHLSFEYCSEKVGAVLSTKKHEWKKQKLTGGEAKSVFKKCWFKVLYAIPAVQNRVYETPKRELERMFSGRLEHRVTQECPSLIYCGSVLVSWLQSKLGWKILAFSCFLLKC